VGAALTIVSHELSQWVATGHAFAFRLIQIRQIANYQTGQPTLSKASRRAAGRGASAGVILGNDAMGRHTVSVSAAGFAQQFGYVANGICNADASAVDQSVTVLSGGAVRDAAGVNVSAARAGAMYANPITSEVYFSEYPYEVRQRNGQAYIYWHPFVTQTPIDATLSYKVSDGGSSTGAVNTGKGAFQTHIRTGPAPALNTVSVAVQASVALPTIRNNALVLANGSIKAEMEASRIYGVLPTIEKIVGGMPDGTFPDRIVLDAESRSARQVEVQYKLLPADYQAMMVEADLFENGSIVDTLSGSHKKDVGAAFIQRGQKFDIHKTYETRLVLNRGTAIQVESDPVRLPTRQRLITFASGVVATVEVDILNKRVCDIPGSLAFGFNQGVRATLQLQKLGPDGAPNGAPTMLFSNKAFEAGSFTHLVEAGVLGSGTFEMILTAVGASDASQPDEARDRVMSRFVEADQLPVAM